jgi:hypothetical protein
MCCATDALQGSVKRFLSEGPALSVRGLFGKAVWAPRAKARGFDGAFLGDRWCGSVEKRDAKYAIDTG